MKFRPLMPKRYYVQAVKLGLYAPRNIAWGVFDRETYEADRPDRHTALCVCGSKTTAERVAKALNERGEPARPVTYAALAH